MSKELSPKPNFENTLAFLADVQVPIDAKVLYPPLRKRQNQARWERDWRIVGEYMGTEQTLMEIGETYDITREGIRKIVRSNIQGLHEASDQEMQNTHPLPTFGYGKPPTMYWDSKGTDISQIARLARAGKSAEEIQAELGLARTRLSSARETLKERGIAVPYFANADSENLERIDTLATQDLTDEEVQERLDSLSYHVYERRSKGEQALFDPISRSARKAGLFIRNDDVQYIAAVLRGQGVPVGVIEKKLREEQAKKHGLAESLRYFFTFSGHEERIMDVLKTNPAFDRYRTNPVQVLGKQDQDTPNTTQLRNSGDYEPVKSIAESVGFTVNVHQSLKLSDIISDDCPVPVFRTGNSHLIKSSDKEAFKEYLARRREELG